MGVEVRSKERRETERKGLGTNGISTSRLWGALMVVKEEYWLQTGIPFFLGRLYKQGTRAGILLAFQYICMHK